MRQLEGLARTACGSCAWPIALAAERAAKRIGIRRLPRLFAGLYPDQIKTSFYLPMRDGVRLAVDLYRPGVGNQPADGKFPGHMASHLRSKICLPARRQRGFRRARN